jgi:hypothetical protein
MVDILLVILVITAILIIVNAESSCPKTGIWLAGSMPGTHDSAKRVYLDFALFASGVVRV